MAALPARYGPLAGRHPYQCLRCKGISYPDPAVMRCPYCDEEDEEPET